VPTPPQTICHLFSTNYKYQFSSKKNTSWFIGSYAPPVVVHMNQEAGHRPGKKGDPVANGQDIQIFIDAWQRLFE